MKLLITGGNGFLGKNVISELNKYNIDILLPPSKELNLLDFNQTHNYLATHQPDIILHLAAKCGGILANKNSPADFLRDNTIMGINIYEAARQNQIKKIYNLGSVCSYPKHCPVPFKEEYIWQGFPEETNAPYGHAKRTLLLLHQTYRQQYGFKGAFFIPVNMYGLHDHFDLINSHVIPALINKFVTATEQNLPEVKCWGTGDATREFLYAGDCAQILIKAILNDFDCEQPINLGTGQDISIKDLASLIGQLIGYQGEIVFTGEVSDGQPKRRLDITRAKNLLNWTTSTTLQDGLLQTIEWFKLNRLNAS